MASHAIKVVKNIGLRTLLDDPKTFREQARQIVPWYLHNRIR
ncbi:MAG: hypothetical protein JWN98_2218, partial [Abditibacteriota bacterium]|nr:hypothetical protein [Abditibacteriota bacterium]